ncbi:MAG: hypothetical protein LUQ22_05275 [Methanotrichaceae archaeon]|nr:hypothetical protein [Methanotrichaceae archaeon]
MLDDYQRVISLFQNSHELQGGEPCLIASSVNLRCSRVKMPEKLPVA